MTRVPTSGIQEMRYTYKQITFRYVTPPPTIIWCFVESSTWVDSERKGGSGCIVLIASMPFSSSWPFQNTTRLFEKIIRLFVTLVSISKMCFRTEWGSRSISLPLSLIIQFLPKRRWCYSLSLIINRFQAILFMNKKDLFEEKIRRVPLALHFPKFRGKEGGFFISCRVNKVLKYLLLFQETITWSPVHPTSGNSSNVSRRTRRKYSTRTWPVQLIQIRYPLLH